MSILTDGEKVYKKMGPSRRSPRLVKFYLLSVVSLATGISLASGMLAKPIYLAGIEVVSSAGLFLMIMFPVLVIIGELRRKWMGVYVITNLRIIVRRGLLRTQMDSVTNKMIVNVKGLQTMPQKLLGIGKVEITTSKGDKEIELRDITGYKDVENLIYKLMETRNEGPYERHSGREAVPVESPAPDVKPGERPRRHEDPGQQQE